MNIPKQRRPELKENAIQTNFRHVGQNKTRETSQYEIVPQNVSYRYQWEIQS